MGDEKIVIDDFGDIEKDAIGEIMNITMGSAATAVSNMLSAKVWITTPTVAIINAKDLSFPELEPSILVKIKYTKGVAGQNVLVLKQNDVQLILNQLMGLPLEVTDDFQFDEMNISAVCEVMNQMMGASATALSEIIDTTVDISTPEAIVQELEDTVDRFAVFEIENDQNVCTIKFNLTIDGVINSEFISILTLDLAREMADKMMAGYNSEPEPVVQESSSGGGALSQAEIEALLGGGSSSPAPEQAPPPAPSQGMGVQAPQQPYYADPSNPAMQGISNMYPTGQMPPPNGVQQYSQPMMNSDPNMMAMQNPMYGMYPQQPYGYPQPPQMNIQPIQLQSFGNYQNPSLSQDQNDNLKLLMDIPLNVTVEIGSTNKKVKDILEFSQGTIIELERQAGAPVDIVVNGNLVAKGDVVVIDDNFAVRITEIIKSKFLDNLGKE